MTLVINLYGGPGTGKSTTAAQLFGALKEANVNTELVTEFAKDLVWEDRRVISCQPYIFGKQLWKMQRLHGKVDVIVTDSPLLMGLVYSRSLGPHWAEVVKAHHDAMSTVDIFIRRDSGAHRYNPEGRYQKTVEEAMKVDEEILHLLTDEVGISLETVRMGRTCVRDILNLSRIKPLVNTPARPLWSKAGESPTQEIA